MSDVQRFEGFYWFRATYETKEGETAVYLVAHMIVTDAAAIRGYIKKHIEEKGGKLISEITHRPVTPKDFES